MFHYFAFPLYFHIVYGSAWACFFAIVLLPCCFTVFLSRVIGDAASAARRHEYAAVAVAFFLYSALMFGPKVFSSSSLVGDSGDSFFSAWNLVWSFHSVITNPLGFYNANVYFPHSFVFAFSEPLLFKGLAAFPVYWFTGDAILSYNLAVLLALPLSSLGMYVL